LGTPKNTYGTQGKPNPEEREKRIYTRRGVQEDRDEERAGAHREGVFEGAKKDTTPKVDFEATVLQVRFGCIQLAGAKTQFNSPKDNREGIADL
jgi:hypothetical protein